MSNKLTTAVNFAPVLDTPDDAPPLKVDVHNPHLTLDDVLPDNFFSMESLGRWLEDRGAESRVLTTTSVTMELLYDPSHEDPKDGEWKPVLWFAETETGLVINKTRGRQLTDLAGSPLLADWGSIGQVALKVGVFNGKAQVGVVVLPKQPKQDGLKLDIDSLR